MTDLTDMQVTIAINVVGSIDAHGKLAISATYAAQSSVPPPVAGKQVVDVKGNIDLRNLAHTAGYSDAVDLTYIVGGTVTTADGSAWAVQFVSPVSQTIVLTRKGGGPVTGLVPSLLGPNTLFIDDQDDDASDYTYCLTILVPSTPQRTGRLDPSIVNR